jgi:hypothetical protein
MRQIQITRIRQDDDVQTLGQGIVFDGIEKVFEFKTLELPWKDNKKNISCIPPGKYWVEKYQSPTPGRGIVFQFSYVKGRSNVQLHKGNFYDDILGCILPGVGFTDIDKDGYLDVHTSGKTMNKLLELMPDKFPVTITEL